MIVLCCYRSKCIVLLVSSVAVVKCDSVYKCDLRGYHMLSGYHATFVDVIRSEENDEVIVGSASLAHCSEPETMIEMQTCGEIKPSNISKE